KLDHKTEVKIEIDIPDLELDLERSIPLGLVLNEIICTSFKHGLPREEGLFICELKMTGDFLEIRIGDNGKGLKTLQKKNGLGLALIEILCDQIEAKKEIHNSENGLYYILKFKP